MRDNIIRLLYPCGGNLTPQQCYQIQMYCDKRPPPPPQPEPLLIEEDDNELDDVMEVEEHVADEVDDEQQNLHPYQLTIYYQDELI